MADLDPNIEASRPVTITGGDEQFQADVVREDDVNKLLVKASVTPTTAARLVFDKALNGGSEDLAVNGSVTPVEFEVLADPTLDKIIRELKFSWYDGGIKIDTFLGLNSPK